MQARETEVKEIYEAVQQLAEPLERIRRVMAHLVLKEDRAIRGGELNILEEQLLNIDEINNTLAVVHERLTDISRNHLASLTQESRSEFKEAATWYNKYVVLIKGIKESEWEIRARYENQENVRNEENRRVTPLTALSILSSQSSKKARPAEKKEKDVSPDKRPQEKDVSQDKRPRAASR